MTDLSPAPKFKAFVTGTSTPLAGGKLYTYLAGTSTPQATAKDKAGTPNTNPIILDANGECDLWLSDISYKYVLKDSADVTIWTTDNVATMLGAFNTAIAALTVETFAALATTPATTAGMTVYLKQHTSGGLGGGHFMDMAGTITNDGGTLINNTVTSGRHWARINIDYINPEMFGVIGNGSNDDTSSWQLCATSQRSIIGTLGATYKLSDKVNVPANTVINLNGASMTQVTDQKPIFDIASVDSVKICGGKFYGKSEATYLNSSNSLARAITGASPSNIVIHDNYFENFYYSALFITTSGSRIAFCRNTVKGPAAILNTNTSYRNTTGVTVIGNQILCADNEIYDTAQGIIIGQGSSNVILNGNRIHDTVNEHGVYCDTSINNLTITNNNIKSVDGNGIKVQNYTSFGGTSRNILIANNNIQDVAAFGGDAIVVYNSAPGGTPLYSFNVNISNNIVDGVTNGNGINIRYCNGATVHKNIITNCTTANSIFFSSCEKLTLSGNIIDGSYKSSLYGTSVIGLCIEHNEIRNPATAGFTTDDYGIYIDTVDDLMLRHNRVYGISATTRYCVYLATGTQSAWSVYGNEFIGAEEYAIRFGSTNSLMEYHDNNLIGTLGKSFNEPALQAVASADALVLPTAQKVISVTGTTTITSISTQGHSGNVVTLLFTEELTVTRGSNIQISADFVTTIQDTLTICCDGNNWFEIARAVN